MYSAVLSALSFVSTGGTVDERRFVMLSPYGGVVCGLTRMPFFRKAAPRRDSEDALWDATAGLGEESEDSSSSSAFDTGPRQLRV